MNHVEARNIFIQCGNHLHQILPMMLLAQELKLLCCQIWPNMITKSALNENLTDVQILEP